MKSFLNDADSIQNIPLPDKVSNQLIDWIMDGKLLMGQKLNTEDIAQQLGVSRMPIREALKNMEKMGLVESVPYVGARLVKLTGSDISQIYMMRRQLEPVAGYHACLHATEDEIAYVRHVHEHFTDILANGTPSAKEIFMNNREFHFSIYASSRLDRICDVISMLWSNLAFAKLIYGQTYVKNKDSSLRMLAEHKEYLDLLERRDAETMQILLKENLGRVQQQIPEKLVGYLEEDAAEGIG